MRSEAWSPWKVYNPPLHSSARRAEMIGQKINIEYLLSTTLHPDLRVILRAVHGDLSRELDGENDNGGEQ